MSGGSLNYFYTQLQEHIGDFGDKELDELVKDLAELFHEREWCLSGDTGTGEWNEARDNFKAKWFTAWGREDRIIGYLDEIKTETLMMVGAGKYCRDCKHWKRESERYGKCEYDTACLTHRCETCKRFEAGEYKDPMDVSIEELELSVRSYNCLRRNGVNKVSDMRGWTVQDLKKVRNLGPKSIREVSEKATAFGLPIPFE